MSLSRNIEVKMIVKAGAVNMLLYPAEQTLTGTVYSCAALGQFNIQRECEEALDNIFHLLDFESIELIKELAPNYCKERSIK